MSLPDAVQKQVTRLLSPLAGTPVRIIRSEPVSAGWSGQFETYPWVVRCLIEADNSTLPASVIVKLRRLAAHGRSELFRFHNETAALEFLTSIGSTIGPQFLAADDEAGILVMEDLGNGPSLEDLLMGSDSSAAADGLVAFAEALGRMHAATAGHAVKYYQLRSRDEKTDSAFDRVSILGLGIERMWSSLQEIMANSPFLPAPLAIHSDIDELLHVLSEPGPFLAFSNGDTCPANCRMTENGLRLFDFEHASFRHTLLDAAALRFPFPACGCWSRLPEHVARRAEDAYRKEMARSCPGVLDPAKFEHGLTVACAAWTIVRMVRLPKLDQGDVPHPIGFSRRGQLLDTIDITVNCSQQSRSLQPLASWLASVSDALRARWPHVPSTQPFYPAFR
ncbi:hypothetical protein [Paenibacillus spongiae]|uniref:Phosphotransferase n=1 Tax=Paenibacillus spongiae TaxID=2909671 RepID=A0ABY5SGR5_9BACL|nr:hypothetical protein [Paenibacillus spongiae]UVI31848.1 hypothetical protein L1F29_08545 [Paenibacillus spongiae]